MTNATTNTIKLSETETIIAEMLRENTGSHFLDSGSAYGRNHERNRGITDEMFKASEPAALSFNYGIEVSLNVFHFLAAHLEYNETVDKVLRIIGDAEDTYGLETSARFLEIVREHGIPGAGSRGDGADGCIGGIYGEGEPLTVNTYNGPDLLSQVILYTYASIDSVTLPLAALAPLVAETERDSVARELLRELARDDATRWDGEPRGIYLSDVFVFLQVHGGCDVRGGYTDVRAFVHNGNTELGILDNGRATIYDAGIEPADRYDDGTFPSFWSTDDAYSWYADGAAGCGAAPELQKFPLHEIDADPETVDGIVERARRLAEDIESDARFNTDDERVSYLSILAESLAVLPYHRAAEYRIALSLFYPTSIHEHETASGYKVSRETVEHGCIAVDDAGIGRSPYTGNRLAASPY